MGTNYNPISCNYYDRLEHWATRGEEVNIVFWENGRKQEVMARIKNLFVRAKVEYMLLDNGLELRLDYLVSVEGFELPKAC
ncbi:hypothetical protein [Xanthovirga aplysinae]|uniref:hypothetical protein n=1 Tax=Xanthovirga aplysinae TaxID=2529853 RepID=UPI0012BCEE3D|nr:hypothetical protein [Xanthovirga aplysinae]MTI30871.1 hypothetical protein [Xanthovirga aplysinae]